MEKHNLPHNHGERNERVFENLPSDGAFESASEIFGSLADKSRMKLFWILCHCEDCVTDLSAMMNMSSPAVSHHLKILKTAKLIVSRREGKEVYYTAAKTEQTKILHHAIEGQMDIICPVKN